MKTFHLIFITFQVTIFSLSAQEKLVPIKQVDKFGLSNLNKEIKLKPIFDKIDFGNRPDYFTGFKRLEDGSFVTSLIHYADIIIKDKPYFDFGIYDDFIIAADTTSEKTIKYHNLFYYEKMHLYDKEGHLLLPDYYGYISIYEDASRIRPTQELMMLFKNLNNTYSLKVYHKKKKSFIKVLLDEVEDFDYINYDEMLWALESMKLTYTKGNVYGKMEVKLIDGSFQIVSDKKTTVKPKPKRNEDYYDEVEVPEFNDQPKKKVQLPKNDSISKTLKQVGIVKNHRDFATTDFLYFENVWYRTEDYSLGFKNGLVGLIDNKKGEYIIPTQYDAIYKMVDNAAFLVKKNNKFGIYFSYLNEWIEPIFEDIPIVVRKRIRDKGFDLIALFDKDTQKLKYYSTFKGEIFEIK